MADAPTDPHKHSTLSPKREEEIDQNSKRDSIDDYLQFEGDVDQKIELFDASVPETPADSGSLLHSKQLGNVDLTAYVERGVPIAVDLEDSPERVQEHEDPGMLSCVSIATELGSERPTYRPIVLPILKAPRLITELNSLPTPRTSLAAEPAAPEPTPDDTLGVECRQWLMAAVYESALNSVMRGEEEQIEPTHPAQPTDQREPTWNNSECTDATFIGQQIEGGFLHDEDDQPMNVSIVSNL